MEEHLLCQREDLSSNPQRPSENLAVTAGMPVTPALSGVEIGGLLGLAGYQLGSRLSKRHCFKGIMWREIEKWTPGLPLASTHACSMFIHHTHSNTHAHREVTGGPLQRADNEPWATKER